MSVGRVMWECYDSIMIRCVWGKGYVGSVMKVIFYFCSNSYYKSTIQKLHICYLPNRPTFDETICLNFSNDNVHIQHHWNSRYISLNYLLSSCYISLNCLFFFFCYFTSFYFLTFWHLLSLSLFFSFKK